MTFKSMLVALFSASVCGTAMADFSLTVLHTNDFHARFEPISKYDNQCGEGKNAEGKCFGGTARLVSAVKAARARAKTSIRRLRNGVFGFHDLSRRVFQSAAISMGGLALSVCVMRLLRFVYLK